MIQRLGNQVGERGSVFIEVLWVFPVLVLCLVFVWELERRASYESLFRLRVCQKARDATLGFESRGNVLKALPVVEARFLENQITREWGRADSRLQWVGYLRFAAFLWLEGKHHYEMTFRCQF